MKLIAYLISVFIIAGSSFSHGQQISFHLNAGANSYNSGSQVEYTEYFFTRSLQINDSTSITQYGPRTFSESFTFSPEAGHEIGLTAEIQLKKRLKVIAGIGTQFVKIDHTSQFTDIDFIPVITDTLIVRIIDSSPFGGCSFTINSPADLPDPDRDPELALLDLSIPVQIEYAIIPDKLDLNLGAIIQTPLLAKATYENLYLHRTYYPGEIVCEYRIKEYEYAALKNLNNIKFNLQAMVKYELFTGVKVYAALRQMLSNTFDVHVNDFRRKYQFKLQGYSFGVSYMLGKKKLTND